MTVIGIVSALIAALLGLFLGFKWKETNSAGRIIFIAIILFTIINAFSDYQKTKEDDLIERINSKYGDLKDLHGATIPKIHFGNTVKGVYYTLSTSGVFAFPFSGPLMQLYVKKGKLYVNTALFDKNKKSIAVIDQNTWTVFDNDYEYNNDDTAFELVKNGSRDVFFHIELINGVAHISGTLLNEEGLGAIFYSRQGFDGALIYPIKSIESSKFTPFGLRINRIFKYPRQKYFGIREDLPRSSL